MRIEIKALTGKCHLSFWCLFVNTATVEPRTKDHTESLQTMVLKVG